MDNEYKFKKISEYMEEFWKTYIIVPSHEGDPSYIVAYIVEKTKEK